MESLIKTFSSIKQGDWTSHVNTRREKGQIQFCVSFFSNHQKISTLLFLKTTKFISYSMLKRSNYFFNYIRSVSSLQKHTCKSFSTWVYASKPLWCPKVRDLENTTIGINQHIVTLGTEDFHQKCYLSSSTVYCWLANPKRKGVLRANKDTNSILFINNLNSEFLTSFLFICYHLSTTYYVGHKVKHGS